MAQQRTDFKWYWFVETEVLCGVALTIGIGLLLLLRHRPYLSAAASFSSAILIGAAFAYQKKLYARIGPGRVHPPRAFKIFWRFVIAIDLLVALTSIVLSELRTGIIGWW
jgi:hypothetical protein